MKKLNAFYRMLIVFSLLAVAAKTGGLLTTWNEVPLWIMIQVFFFAGVSHFTPLRHEFVKMIPPVFPANYYAAKHDIRFRGAKPLSVLQRGLVQVAFIAALYFGGIHQ